MRAKEDRIHFEDRNKKKQIRTIKINGCAYDWKSKEDRFELDPNKCYITENSKWKSKKLYKNISSRTIRNRYKKDLREKDFDDIGQFNGSADKLFDYKWSVW